MSLLSKASLVLTPNAVKESKLYSIIPSNGNGDMTVTRATTATRVNSEGFIEEVPYNLVKYSEMFTDASWAKSNTSVTPNVMIAPNGTLTADLLSRTSTSAGCQIFSDYNFGSSSIYTLTLYAKIATVSTNFGLRIQGAYPDRGDATFNLSTKTLIGTANGGTNTNTTASILDVGNGWCKLSITTQFAMIRITPRAMFGATTLGVGFTNVWESGDGFLSNAYVWGVQMVQGSVQKDYFPTTDRLNVPRLKYDSAGGCPSILLEPQRTNSYEYSQDYSQSVWILSGVTLSNINIVNPIGENNSSVITEQNSVTGHSVQALTNSFTSGLYYTTSIFVKKGNGITAPDIIQLTLASGSFGTAQYANFNISTGVVTFSTGGTATIVPYLNGWFRISWTAVCTVTSSVAQQILIAFCDNNPLSGRSPAYAGLTTSNVFIFGAQSEQGAYPTSYIPTLATAVTRNADDIYKTGISDLLNPSEGVFFVQGSALVNDSLSRSITLSDSSDYNQITIQFTSNTNQVRFDTYGKTSPTTTANYRAVVTIPDITANNKFALKWGSEGIFGFVNGVKYNLVLVVGSGNGIPTSLNRFDFKQYWGGIPFFSKTKLVLIFKNQLTDSECIQLTTL